MIIETTLAVTDKKDAVAKLTAKDELYRNEQQGIKDKALHFEQLRDEELAKSSKRIQDRDGLTYAGVAVQLGIAIASLAAMTKKDRIFQLTVLVTVASLAMTAYCMLKVYL